MVHQLFDHWADPNYYMKFYTSSFWISFAIFCFAFWYTCNTPGLEAWILKVIWLFFHFRGYLKYIFHTQIWKIYYCCIGEQIF